MRSPNARRRATRRARLSCGSCGRPIAVGARALILRYAAPDTSIAGVVVGLLVVALLLTFLGALGITFSTIFSNVLFTVLLLMLIVIVFQGAVLQFLGLTWMSTTAVVIALPDTFRGTTPIWDLVRVFLVFSSLTAAACATSIWVFRERDL